MLKRLELVGFKSFADKTAFDFAGGITAIVGPNGSGKSNIVDAVRWIMGEQSAKSLRGGEMADVIFNGSSTRKSLGLAEVTMIFDNAKRQLSIDQEEVQITRRVYRDGQGEYLINGQVTRLRDIKDLFLGSGAGNDALCIIAQGKVDVLLQSSTKDRRMIFEEAAGISRFKAKKIEAQRKLERVDQNLARVKDIVDEVEKQYRTVKQQAAKAQRYQELNDQLKSLRLHVGLEEYGTLQTKLRTEKDLLGAMRADLDQRAARAGACEAEVERLEMALADVDDALRQREGALAKVVQHIKSQESTWQHESSLSADHEAELAQTRKRLVELTSRVRVLEEARVHADAELAEAESQALIQRQEVHTLEAALRQVESEVAQIQQQQAADKSAHFELMRRVAYLQNESFAKKAHVDNLHRERARLLSRSAQAAEHLAHIDVELEQLTQAEEQLQERLAVGRQGLIDAKAERERLRREHDSLIGQLSEARQRRSGLESRIDLLQGLIDSHEGLGTGVREVFALLETEPWTTVLGMIGDFLTVKREYAGLIDLALGDWAQRFVVRDPTILAQGLAEKTFSGRVSFMPLAGLASTKTSVEELRSNRLVEVSLLSRVRELATTPDHPGLVAPADQLVSCDHSELGDLPSQLLGRTLIVHDLATALSLADKAPGFRFVTLAGELLEPDGTLTVGTHHGATGILSRKSELVELRAEKLELDERIAGFEQTGLQLKTRAGDLERQLARQEEELAVLAEQTAEMKSRVQGHRDRRQGLHEEVVSQRDEIGKIDHDVVKFEEAWQKAQQQAAEADAQVALLQERMTQADAALRGHESERGQRQQTCTQAQVSFATMEERLSGLRSRHHQLSRDLQQRAHELAQSQTNVTSLRGRMLDCQQAMLRASSQTAQAALDKETLQRTIQELIAQRDFQRQERTRLAQQGQLARNEWRGQQEQYHQRELEVNNLSHQSGALTQRMLDDYQIDLPTLYDQRAGEQASIETAAATLEIDDLRKKLAKLGAVNLEALSELAELEVRAKDLQTQYADLVEAQKSLQDIIHKINQDSRKMFVETFDTIRGHFQELFRKLFGGGMADVILEDENDVLESGIEINAKPPGKELRSISLLSGGEKTLAAVALLLAIFRSKPSPFCLLDEVDAALDEANIARYTSVIREFLDLSQFIIVTHSKKTMAAADVIYGITMQESGISKQVAIRFEDWVDPENFAPIQGKQEVA